MLKRFVQDGIGDRKVRGDPDQSAGFLDEEGTLDNTLLDTGEPLASLGAARRSCGTYCAKYMHGSTDYMKYLAVKVPRVCHSTENLLQYMYHADKPPKALNVCIAEDEEGLQRLNESCWFFSWKIQLILGVRSNCCIQREAATNAVHIPRKSC